MFNAMVREHGKMCSMRLHYSCITHVLHAHVIDFFEDIPAKHQRVTPAKQFKSVHSKRKVRSVKLGKVVTKASVG